MTWTIQDEDDRFVPGCRLINNTNTMFWMECVDTLAFMADVPLPVITAKWAEVVQAVRDVCKSELG